MYKLYLKELEKLSEAASRSDTSQQMSKVGPVVLHLIGNAEGFNPQGPVVQS